jgi:hypothetical protein
MGRVGLPNVRTSCCLGWGDEPEPRGLGPGFASPSHVELSQDCRDVMIDRPLRHHQPLGDLTVAHPPDEQAQHLELSRGQPSRVLARGGARSPREPLSASLAKSFSAFRSTTPVRSDHDLSHRQDCLRWGPRSPIFGSVRLPAGRG